jgi:hypothetical protein
LVGAILSSNGSSVGITAPEENGEIEMGFNNRVEMIFEHKLRPSKTEIGPTESARRRFDRPNERAAMTQGKTHDMWDKRAQNFFLN